MMFLKFSIIVLILQCGFGFEIDEYEVEMLDGYLTEELHNEKILIPIKPKSAIDHENVIKEKTPRGDDVDLERVLEDERSQEDEEEEVVFSGPVKAKGTVAVGANFGYAPPPPISYTSYTSPFFPPYFPHFLYPPPFAYPMQYNYPYMPIVTTFLPGMGITANHIDYNIQNEEKTNAETVVKNAKKEQSKTNRTKNKRREDLKIKSDDKDTIYIDVIPIKNNKTKDSSQIDKNEITKEDNVVIDDQALEGQVFSDEDFTDYDEENAIKEETPEGVVFGGFLPASGSVKIAAKF